MTAVTRSTKAAKGSRDEPRRVTIVPGGPILVEGPVELLLPDGTKVHSDRFVVAICACRRSRRYPFCDTSHRTRERKHPRDAENEAPARA